MKNLKWILPLIMLITACSSTSSLAPWRDNDNYVLKDYVEIPSEDYLAHIKSLGDDYRNSEGITILPLSAKSKKYLTEIYDRIVDNNELLFETKYKPTFYLVKDSTPFLFSLPQGQFYFSTGLIAKYLKNESVMIAAFSFEVIKNGRNLFPKKRIVPIGHMSTERIMTFTRIPLELRIEVDRWCFYALERASYDSYAFMLWIQIQNKNTTDFTLQYGDARGISREEYLLKNIMIRDNQDDIFEEEEQRSTSGEFYRFINEVKRLNNA